MAALHHVRCRTTVHSALRQLLLIPRNQFSSSMVLENRYRKREEKVATRFARIEPPESRSKKLAQTTVSLSQTDEAELQPTVCRAVQFDSDLVDNLLKKVENDMPLSDMPDPFVKDYHRCFLCTNDVKVDYKNVRLLSQFVSPYTGRIYGTAITGLCIPMQDYVTFIIKRARATGYMPVINKDPRYLHDPQPFNPMKKQLY